MTKTKFAVTGLILTLAVMAALPTAQAAPCLVVTLTGTQGGPQIFNGLAGAGTLVSYGEDGNNFGAVKMQFDAGRGTNMRLSQIGMAPEQLNAIFFTLPPNFYYRQSSAFDLGAMAKRAGAKHLMLTHLIPAAGAERHGPLKIPNGPLNEADYRNAVQESGFNGNTIVGTDLASLRLPAK